MTELESAISAKGGARITGTLARYPAVNADELRELQHWFRKEATALDVGLIASDASLAEPYRRSAEHLQPLKAGDWTRAAVFLSTVTAFVGAIVLMAY